MNKDRFIRLVKKYLAGRTSYSEEDALHRYFEDFQNPDVSRITDNNREDRMLRNLHAHIRRDRSPRGVPRVMIAASLLFVIGVASWLLRDSVSVRENPQWVEVRTIRGQRKLVTLPDGSILRLNAESAISYPEDFGVSKRSVRIDGEVFLEIRKDSGKPFSVLTDQMVIHVLGTKFNVRAYADEDFAETTLVEGSIRVNVAATKQILDLQPSQKLTVKAKGRVDSEAILPSRLPERVEDDNKGVRPDVQPEHTDTFQETSWTRNILSFDGDSFSEIAEALERWYDIEVVFANEAMANWRFTATLRVDDGVEDALEALRMTRKFTFRKEGKTILIN